MPGMSLYATACLLVSRMQKGEHVLVVGPKGEHAIYLAAEICRQDDREQLKDLQGVSVNHIQSWRGYAYTTEQPDQEITCADGASMDLVLILDDAVPPWGIYPYGCPVLRVHVDDSYD